MVPSGMTLSTSGLAALKTTWFAVPIAVDSKNELPIPKADTPPLAKPATVPSAIVLIRPVPKLGVSGFAAKAKALTLN